MHTDKRITSYSAIKHVAIRMHIYIFLNLCHNIVSNIRIAMLCMGHDTFENSIQDFMSL